MKLRYNPYEFTNRYEYTNKKIRKFVKIRTFVRKVYELTYIINPNLSEREVAVQSDKVRSFINGLGGEMKSEKLNEKRKLAYPIKKQSFGFYATAEFSLEPEKISELEKQIKLEQRVIRHLIIVKERMIPMAARSLRLKKVVPAPKPAQETRVEKVKIEEIDKKLEEILEE